MQVQNHHQPDGQRDARDPQMTTSYKSEWRPSRGASAMQPIDPQPGNGAFSNRTGGLRESEPTVSNRGKGPRNYRRSDERIRDAVCGALTDDSLLDASDLDVSVAAGEVVLSGTVDGLAAKRRAALLAEETAGVTNVENRIRLRTAGPRSSKAGEGQ